jgi:hypothetical protein
MAERRTQQRETRLLAEWLAERVYPIPYRQRQVLGPPVQEAVEQLGPRRGLRASNPWRPEVDAIAWPAGELWIIEAKIRQVRDGIAQLPVYAGLVDSTPELAAFRGRRRRLVLVTPFDTEQARAMAKPVGVDVEIYRPEWIAVYMNELNEYWTGPARAARDERNRLRERFGLE